jgi:gliding motility-associated-like protein
MKSMKNTALLAFVILFSGMKFSAQTISPQVINSAGSSDRQVGSLNIYISDNIGEPFVQTMSASSVMITQGFLQPAKTGATYTYVILQNSVTCMDKKDGMISVSFSSSYTNSSISYFWSTPDGKSKAGGNKIDSLSAGVYSLQMIYTYQVGNVMRTDTIQPAPIPIANSDLICKITIFTGFTPNNDGINDVWTIGNIAEFPKNRVTLFNRWGSQVADIKGYDNVSRAWPDKSQLDKLPASTYFYIIDLGDGTKPYMGWVEVLKSN